MAVGGAGGDVGVADLLPAGRSQVVFVAGSAVHMLGNAAYRGVLQMHDHRPPGGKLTVKLLQAFGQAARVAGVAARGPDRTVRPHAAAGAGLPVQDGAGVAQSVPAALAGGLVADRKDLAGIEAQQVDAVRFLQRGCMGVGDGHCQQQAKRHKGRCQPLCRAGGAVLHVFHILCDFLT